MKILSKLGGQRNTEETLLVNFEFRMANDLQFTRCMSTENYSVNIWMINWGRWRKWSNVGVDFVEISLGSLLAGVERLFSRSARNTPVDWYLPRKGEPPWCRATFDNTDLHAPCEVAYLHKYFPSYFLLSCGRYTCSYGPRSIRHSMEKADRSTAFFRQFSLPNDLWWILRKST